MEGSQTQSSAEYKFKVGDRVKRVGQSGCSGVVKNIRVEVTASGEARLRAPMFVVLWDNGTQSYLSQEALEISRLS
ncbi:MAG: hypothetical protein QY326_00935 [Bdellovibrionota bacterium]|nr:MAG: hypothetical protein QY326_00935 [Bdellovibrionota bacterium]